MSGGRAANEVQSTHANRQRIRKIRTFAESKHDHLSEPALTIGTRRLSKRPIPNDPPGFHTTHNAIVASSGSLRHRVQSSESYLSFPTLRAMTTVTTLRCANPNMGNRSSRQIPGHGAHHRNAAQRLPKQPIPNDLPGFHTTHNGIVASLASLLGHTVAPVRALLPTGPRREFIRAATTK